MTPQEEELLLKEKKASIKQDKVNKIPIVVKWGSEIQPFKIRKQLKFGLFDGQISNGPGFKWL